MIEPRLLSRQTAQVLLDADECARWIEDRLDTLPSRLRPAPLDAAAFTRLFASFFQTSFRIEQRGTGVETYFKIVPNADKADVSNPFRLRRPSPTRRRQIRRDMRVLILAAIRALDPEGIEPRLDSAAELVLTRKALQPDAVLWAWACEIVHRSRDDSHGTSAHHLWCLLDRETKADLTPARIWEARQRLVKALRLAVVTLSCS